LREERRLRTFEDRVLRKIFGPKRDHEENFIMMNFMACILHRIFFGVIKSRRMGEGGTCDTHGGGDVFTGF
jgi:hypothetical protein